MWEGGGGEGTCGKRGKTTQLGENLSGKRGKTTLLGENLSGKRAPAPKTQYTKKNGIEPRQQVAWTCWDWASGAQPLGASILHSPAW